MLLGGAVVARADNGPIVRFATPLGNIDVRLLPQDAPQTVANFLSYVSSGAYNGSFFHRAVDDTNLTPPFEIIQGGGYRYQNGGLQVIKAQPAIENEFLDSNVTGTLAMALVGNDPNSGTDQWFFNLSDNSQDLDPQLFTVFGKVLDSAGMAVANQILQEPATDLNSAFGQSGTSCPASGIFCDVPTINYTSGGLSPSNLVTVTSISEIDASTPPTITINTPTDGEQFDQGQVTLSDFSCSDGNGVGISSCTGPSNLNTSKVGQQTFTVTATDYAGNTTTEIITYTIDPPTPAPPGPSLPGLEVTGWAQSRTGVVSVGLHCRVRAGCSGTTSLAVGTRKNAVGSGSYSLTNGQTKEFPLALTRKGKRILSGSKGRIAAWFTITRPGHAPIVQKARLRT